MSRHKKIRDIRDYKPREQAYYRHGDGSIFRVEVLKNDSGNSNPHSGLRVAGYVGYDLRILEVIKIVELGRFRVTPKDGLEFGVQKLGNFDSAGSNWELSDKMFKE